MSLTIAMSNALSGLTAASRGVELVSDNVANAGTEGYARRELQLQAAISGGRGTGVRVTGVVRQRDVGLLNNLRPADAEVAAGRARLDFRAAVATIFGTGDEQGSLSGSVAALSAALAEAASRPDSTARLAAAVAQAGELAAGLRRATGTVQAARASADHDIATGVQWLNDALEHTRQLNRQIVSLEITGRDASALKDQREVLIGQIAQWVPVREVERDHGAVALVTSGGAVLLDSKAAELAFSSAGVVTADMAVGGALSTLTLNGREVPLHNGEGLLGGGRLGALFDVRDHLAVEAQATLDAMARDLYERFADPAVDPGLAPGQPGLFTDMGTSFDPALEVGLAGRLRLNAAVDPMAGGAVWRLRDGLAAAVAGPAGNSAQLNRLADALDAPRAAASGPFGNRLYSAGTLAGEAAAIWSAGTATLETSLTIAGGRADALRSLHLQEGVDTDAEMQKLMVLEQAYGANARVISTIDDMLQQLLRL